MSARKKPAKEIYEVLVGNHSLQELRNGHTNVVLGAIARPRGIIGDKSAILATLTIVEINSSSSTLTLDKPKRRKPSR